MFYWPGIRPGRTGLDDGVEGDGFLGRHGEIDKKDREEIEYCRQG